MNDFFKDLFLYNQDCNQRLAERIALYENAVSDKSLQLLSHVVNAHHIWNNRIWKRKNIYDRMQVHSPMDFKQIDLDNHVTTLSIIDSWILPDELHYINTKGEQAIHKVQDILFHVVNHSTYHRGQIASDLKQSGIEPVVTDFIFYKK